MKSLEIRGYPEVRTNKMKIDILKNIKIKWNNLINKKIVMNLHHLFNGNPFKMKVRD